MLGARTSRPQRARRENLFVTKTVRASRSLRTRTSALPARLKFS